MRAHHLRVESWHGGSSICDKCECGEVQDEKHVLFFCECAEVCELHMRYRDLFEGMFKTLRVFAPSSSEFIPFLTCHHSITDFEINAFLNRDEYVLKDGDKTARVHPTYGVKQGCPPVSSAFFPLY